MKNFIQNIKKHWIIALVCMAVLLAAIAFAVIVLRKGNGMGADEQDTVRQGYFEDTDYPVYVTERKGNVLFELDGSVTPELVWQTAFTDETVAAAAEGAQEHSGNLKAELLPLQTGYTVVSFTRTGEIGGVSFDAAVIRAELYATTEADGTMTLRCSNVYQELSTAGAADTDAPYILEGNCVLLPNGGDWTLTYRKPDGITQDEYYIEEGQNEDGVQMFIVYPRQGEAATRSPEDLEGGDVPDDDDEAEAAADTVQGLVLRSASLGRKVQLACVQGDSVPYILRPVEAANEE